MDILNDPVFSLVEWRFPSERFVQYEESDKRWAIPLGLCKPRTDVLSAVQLAEFIDRRLPFGRVSCLQGHFPNQVTFRFDISVGFASFSECKVYRVTHSVDVKHASMRRDCSFEVDEIVRAFEGGMSRARDAAINELIFN